MSGSKSSSSSPPIPYGFCGCGCGERTTLARQTDRQKGWVRGEPIRYVRGHYSRVQPSQRRWGYVVEDRGFASPCWVWQLSASKLGYGEARDGKKIRRAHVVYYERVHGPVPDGLELDHLCSVRSCVNPAHLEPVTHTENVRRGAKTKLTVEQVVEMRRLREHEGLSYPALGRVFGVTGTNAHDVCKRKIWKDV